KSWWRYRDGLPAAQQEADIRSNNLEWQHGDATHVQVRYLAQQNLFAGNPGSDLIEIAGNTTVMQTRRSDIGVTLRVAQERLQNMMPSLVMWSDESSVLPRYAYSFGFVSGDDKNSRLSAIAAVSAADSPLRVVFTDGFEQFWEGMYIDNGDIRRDLRLAYRKEIGRYFLINISSCAGTATPTHTLVPTANKVYVTGDVQSTYFPSGTTLALSYRQLHE